MAFLHISVVRFLLIDLSLHFPVPAAALLKIPYTLWQIVRTLYPLLSAPVAVGGQGVDGWAPKTLRTLCVTVIAV